MNIQVPYKWIKEYADIKLSANELAQLLPTRGPQVEKVYFDESLQDDVFDIEITSNRIDTASVIGIAREAASITNTHFNVESTNLVFPQSDLETLKVSIKDNDKCRRFNAIVIDGIKVKQSPPWLKRRLEALGKNSINLLVDISNYVLLEYGYPTHIFDYAKIQDSQIIIRRARQDEKFISLDNEAYKLDSNDLVIADTQKVLSLAGIKGGINSGVSATTSTIVIEAANFEPYGIRKTARKLDLHTDASSLFEKNLSPHSSIVAIQRVAQLVLELAGGKIASTLKDEKNDSFKAQSIDFDISRIKRILGIDLEIGEVIQILESLDFNCERKSETLLSVTVPHFRANDVEHDYDLVEEIGRIYGYENIKGVYPDGEIPPVSSNLSIEWEDKIKDILVGAGLTEAFNLSIVGDIDLQRVDIAKEDVIEISNPLTQDFKYMRRELTSSMLSTQIRNEDYRDTLSVFEINTVYIPESKLDLPKEQINLALLITSSSDISAFREAKSYFEHLLRSIGIDLNLIKYIDKTYNFFKPTKSASIQIENKVLGFIGIVSTKFGTKKSSCIIEINLDLLLKYIFKTIKSFKGIPKYQSTRRDFAFLLDENVRWQEVKDVVLDTSELINSVDIFDLYTGKGIPEGKKSIAFSITIQPIQKTLDELEISEITAKIISEIQNKLSGELRSI